MLVCWSGAQCFLAQLNVQRTELLERLSTAHNFCNLDDEDNYIAASKAVRQVLQNCLSRGAVWWWDIWTDLRIFFAYWQILGHNWSLLYAFLQVIHQLKQLGTVWQDVLPVSNYCKAIGNLINTAIGEITTKIMMLEVCSFSSNSVYTSTCSHGHAPMTPNSPTRGLSSGQTLKYHGHWTMCQALQ